MTIVLNLPMPPSVNRMWKARGDGSGIYKTPDADAWAQAAAWDVTAQRKRQTIPGPFAALVEVEAIGVRSDLDNRLKLTLDACQGGGAIANDCHAMLILTFWSDALRGVRVTLIPWRGTDSAIRKLSRLRITPKRRELCPTCSHAFDVKGRPTCDCPEDVTTPQPARGRVAA